MDKGKWDRGYW